MPAVDAEELVTAKPFPAIRARSQHAGRLDRRARNASRRAIRCRRGGRNRRWRRRTGARRRRRCRAGACRGVVELDPDLRVGSVAVTHVETGLQSFLPRSGPKRASEDWLRRVAQQPQAQLAPCPCESTRRDNFGVRAETLAGTDRRTGCPGRCHHLAQRCG